MLSIVKKDRHDEQVRFVAFRLEAGVLKAGMEKYKQAKELSTADIEKYKQAIVEFKRADGDWWFAVERAVREMEVKTAATREERQKYEMWQHDKTVKHGNASKMRIVTLANKKCGNMRKMSTQTTQQCGNMGKCLTNNTTMWQHDARKPTNNST